MRSSGAPSSELTVAHSGARVTKTGAILAALAISPRSNAELCEIADDIPSYVARTMAKLRHEGRVANIAPRKGRGTRALYALANVSEAA